MRFHYSCWRIFSLPLRDIADAGALPAGYRFAELSRADLSTRLCAELRRFEQYAGQDSCSFGILGSDGVVACIQCMWFGERYRRESFWPLEADEAASVQTATATGERRKGLATQIKQHSAVRMKQKGFSRLYSRVWWTNTASVRVHKKAGWSHVGTTFEILVPGFRRSVRLVFHTDRHTRALNELR
jgi:Acetyltransferase (GNAT) family